jgi:hypothetical protein
MLHAPPAAPPPQDCWLPDVFDTGFFMIEPNQGSD